MNEADPTALTLRLDRLEHQDRRHRIVLTCLLGTLGLVVLVGATGQTVPNEIRATRFVVVDSKGLPRAQLALTEGADVVGLTLFDKSGKNRARLTVGAGVPELLISGSDVEGDSLHRFAALDLIRWGLRREGHASLSPGGLMLMDKQVALRADLTTGTLALFDRDGKEIRSQGATAPGPRTWILWRQLMLFYGAGQPKQITMAVSAWLTKSECETARAQANAAQPKPLEVLHACLPDTAKLPEQR